MRERRREIIAALERNQVRYVVIGGVAAQAHGWEGTTFDVDITPEASRENLELLATAMRELNAKARIEGYPDGFELPGGIDAATFELATTLAFVTDEGNLDVALRPDGTRGYDDLVRNAAPREIEADCTAPVASLADVIRSKEAAGRPKDTEFLPVLRELLNRLGE